MGGTDPTQVTPDPADPELPRDPEKPVVNLNSTDTDVMVH
ncbi:hypothetical protein ADIS_0783 [Lunatimonas lonarensis]|uniref:Uncharacterized protein n=1 Tax=Lunatimonas lonarensis TaxID=1232681 RepID=R7ZXK1_9BACT|nr:hypothetical protein ADIS_0783 [Lunatimonas lonarensis]